MARVKLLTLRPTEIWFSALIIFTRMGIMSVSTLSMQIGAMRDWVRGQFIDIRTNTTVVKALYSYLADQVPKKKIRDEIPAAQDYEGDDVDPRDVRAAKRQRQSEEQDPSYRGDKVPRGNESALSGTRNANAAAQPQIYNQPAASPTRLTRPPVSAQPSMRPAQASMDRAVPLQVGATFGQMPANPYGNPNQVVSVRLALSSNSALVDLTSRLLRLIKMAICQASSTRLRRHSESSTSIPWLGRNSTTLVLAGLRSSDC